MVVWVLTTTDAAVVFLDDCNLRYADNQLFSLGPPLTIIGWSVLFSHCHWVVC